MDIDPARHEQSMARWTFVGSLGVVAGPLALGLGLAAQQFGLGKAMWLLLLGPIVLMIGLPRQGKRDARARVEP
jgi:hypothetical protein